MALDYAIDIVVVRSLLVLLPVVELVGTASTAWPVLCQVLLLLTGLLDDLAGSVALLDLLDVWALGPVILPGHLLLDVSILLLDVPIGNWHLLWCCQLVDFQLSNLLTRNRVGFHPNFLFRM